MGRLFWKFFAFIWLAQLAAMLGIGGMLWLRHYAHDSPRPEIATHPSAAFMVDSAELALRHGGRAALTELLSRAGPQAPFAVDETGRDLLGRPVDPNTLAAALKLQHNTTHAPIRTVRLPDNRSLLLFSLRQPFPARMPPPGSGSPDRGPNQPAFLPLTPFLMALPSVNESERRLMTRSISLARSVSFSRSANSTSSSLKSSSSSTSEANVSSFSRSRISSRLNPPRICCIAKRCEAAEVEAIRSATASACERSSFPLVKALRVNSPGWARRQPARNRRLMICC